MAEASEEKMVEPKISGFQFKGSLLGSFTDILDRLSSLQLFTTEQKDNSLIIFRVESRDIQKRPFLFTVMTFYASTISVEYSVIKDTSEKLRKLSVLRSFMGVLSLLNDLYRFDEQALLQYVDTAIDDLLGSLSQNYSTLFNSYDSLLQEHKELKKMAIDLTNSNKNLTAQAAKLSSENEELGTELKKLQTYSDESLMAMVEEWIESHDSTIDVVEFAKANRLSPPRVEQILNKMVSSGYIELKG